MKIDSTTIRRGKRTLKAFVTTLGYSRASYVHFYDNERSESWMDTIERRLGEVKRYIMIYIDEKTGYEIEMDMSSAYAERFFNKAFSLSRLLLVRLLLITALSSNAHFLRCSKY